MKILSTALLAAGLVSLAACGGGATNNAASNAVTNELPPVENVGDANLAGPTDLNSAGPVDVNASGSASGNAVATNSAGNGL
jgi:hypothetical protein